jgi:hypothetical protein
MVLKNLLDGGPSRTGSLIEPSESMRGGTPGTNPRHAGRFCLRTLSYSRPAAIVELIVDTVVVSRVVVGTSCKELEKCVNMCLLCSFIVPVRAHRFASSVVTPQG